MTGGPKTAQQCWLVGGPKAARHVGARCHDSVVVGLLPTDYFPSCPFTTNVMFAVTR
jgi:hypothetical protein